MKLKHKGLRALARTDTSVGVSADLAPRLRRILTRLQAATGPAELANWPGLRVHPLKGDRRGYWAVRASGNWRVVFRFESGEAVDVDLVDYH